jgi:hypothetical protein
MLSIVDRKTFTILNSITDFFKYKSVSTKPIAACADKTASTVVAISQHPTTDRNIIHFYKNSEGIERIRIKYLTRAFPDMSKAFTLEVSQSGKFGFIGGIHKKSRKPMILCFEMNKTLSVVSYIILDEFDFGQPRIIKRVSGHNVLIVGCNYHYCIVNFKNYKFYLLGKLRDIHKSRVLDFEFRANTLYSKGENESSLKVIKFGNEADINDQFSQSGGTFGRTQRSESEESRSVSSISQSPSFSKISQTPQKSTRNNMDSAKGMASGSVGRRGRGKHVKRKDFEDFREISNKSGSVRDSKLVTDKKARSRAPSVAFNSAQQKNGLRPRQGLMLSGRRIRKLQ